MPATTDAAGSVANHPRRTLIVGNWKMHGLGSQLSEIAAVAAAAASLPPRIEIAICPPFTLIERAARVAAGSRLRIGAQDIDARVGGPHTGNVAGAMLHDAGATLVIVGHSERRADREDDVLVLAKAKAALAAGLAAIVCVGETEADRNAGHALAVIAAQLAGSIPDPHAELIIAYEPVWAIGTGRTPTLAEVAEVHALIRGVVGEGVRILYGGSVNTENARALLRVANVDGALVGGASLAAASFLAIAAAAN